MTTRRSKFVVQRGEFSHPVDVLLQGNASINRSRVGRPAPGLVCSCINVGLRKPNGVKFQRVLVGTGVPEFPRKVFRKFVCVFFLLFLF